MRKYTLVVVVLLLAGTTLVWRIGRVGAQAPGDAGVTPVRGAWTPHVIATARPVSAVEEPAAAPVPPLRPDGSPIARATPPPKDPVTARPAVSGGAAGEAPRQRDPVPTAPSPPGPCLVVGRVAPAAVSPGKPLVYDIVVRNVGGAPAQRVQVEEQLPPGATVTGAEPRPETRGSTLVWDLGTLAAGAEARLRVTLQPAGDGDITTTATVTCATTSTLRAHVPRGALSLTVTGPPSARLGDGVTFQIQLANNAAAPSGRLLLRARLSPGLQHPQGSEVEAELPPLAPGEVKSVPLDAVASKAGRLGVTATVAAPGVAEIGSGADVEVAEAAAAPAAPPAPAAEGAKPAAPTAPAPAPERKPATPPPALPLPPPVDVPRPESRSAPPRDGPKPIASAGRPAVTLDVADPAQALEVGRETTYEIRVLNQGAAPSRDVLVQAVVPDEMTLVGADGPGGRQQVRGKQVAFAPLASLDPQGQAVYRVRVKALKPGDGHFQALLQCGPTARPVREEVSTRVYSDETEGGRTSPEIDKRR